MQAVVQRVLARLGLRWLQNVRHQQLLVLTILWLYGSSALGFPFPYWGVLVTGTAALLAQWICVRRLSLAFEWRSAMITALSVAILLRVSEPAWLAVGAGSAVVSKFLLRLGNRHFFNPANFGLVLVMLFGKGWVAPGQWGSLAFFGFLTAALGTMIAGRVRTLDITHSFLGGFALLVLGRSLYLGDPLAVPLHTLRSGSLILFAFFMISDPKTAPARRLSRVLHGMLVAVVSGYLLFFEYRSDAVIWALVLLAPLVPVWDVLVGGNPFAWTRGPFDITGRSPHSSPHGRHL